MANSEAVAHTPQPHIGEAYVGITRSISTMYRGAVPITKHQPARVLEPLRGTGWRGYPDPTKALRSGRFACPALRAIVGLGGMRNRSAVHVISILVGATAAYRLSYNKPHLVDYDWFRKLPRSGFAAPEALYFR